MLSMSLDQIKELEKGKIVLSTVSDNKTVDIVNVGNMYYLTVSKHDKVTSITRVTREYLVDEFETSGVLFGNDILYPTLLTVIQERFWIHNVEDPNLAINMSYLMKCNPIPTIRRWLKGLPVNVVLTDRTKPLTKRAAVKPRTALYEIIKDIDGISITVHTRYTGGTKEDPKDYIVGYDEDFIVEK